VVEEVDMEDGVNDLVVQLTAILTTGLSASRQEDSCLLYCLVNDELASRFLSSKRIEPTAVLSPQASSFTWFGSSHSYQDFSVETKRLTARVLGLEASLISTCILLRTVSY
jgi:hypothetical protein